MVRMVILFALVAISASKSVQPITPPPRDCVHWCTNPITNSKYCCNDGTGIQHPIEDRLGECPEHRQFCPRDGVTSGPALCAHDGYCSNPESKCCWDTCLQHHTCKPAIFIEIYLKR
ncbi:uncharacterized protein [Palaemon carinicauda]|uniref:uncharacterized protein isoform X3 n=1 Tax=Palaemon carinicauda TaxID=392227 RepID=UPI0035B64BA3